jgi:hypothetical protein
MVASVRNKGKLLTLEGKLSVVCFTRFHDFSGRINRVIAVFETKRDEVTVEWRKLHNEELHDLYSSPNIVRVIKSRRMRWAGHVARMGEVCTGIWCGKPEGKRPLGRPRRRWEDNIKIYLPRRVMWGCGLD